MRNKCMQIKTVIAVIIAQYIVHKLAEVIRSLVFIEGKICKCFVLFVS